MYRRHPGALGRTESIASLTTTTAVVNALATGVIDSEKFVRKWMLRAEAASAADRVRIVKTFASASGTFLHEGTPYSDTTATSEKIEILEVEPYLVDNAINVALGRLRRIDREIIPGNSANRVYMSDLSWIQEPGDVARVAWCGHPGLCRNANLQKYNTVNTSGVLQPDSWTLSGSGATMVRSTTQTRKAPYSLAITRSGTNCVVSQEVGLLDSGVSDDTLIGKTVTAFAWVWSSVASQVKVHLYDEVNASVIASSSFHTGGSGWEELSTAETTLASTVEGLTCRLTVDDDNAVVYVARLDIVRGALNDSVRRENYTETDVGRPEWDQGNGPLSAILPGRNGGQWVFYTHRAYPEFDADRIIAGSADADSTDAPLITVAVGALARLYEGLAQRPDGDNGQYGYWAQEWGKKADQLYTRHLYQGNDSPYPGGIQVTRRNVPWAAGRA